MKNRFTLLLALLCLANTALLHASQVSIMSWDLNDFGIDRGDFQIGFIANVVKDFDVIALQNVAPNAEGSEGVAFLVKELKNRGFHCDYRISKSTTSPDHKQKCYAYLWKPSKVQLIGEPWLDDKFENEICREPFMARFKVSGQELLCINYFAQSHPDSSAKEIKCFYQYPDLYPDEKIVITGNFNTPCSNAIFNPLRITGFTPNLEGLPTTLREECGGDRGYLVNPVDFILFDQRALRILRTGTSDFIRNCMLLPNASKISNHIPVWVVLGL